MPTAPRPAAAVAAWCGAALSPVVLYAATTVGGMDSEVRVTLAILAQLLPVGLLRRRPLPALVLLLLGLAAVMVGSRPEWPARNLEIIMMIEICVAVGYLAAARPRRMSLLGAALALGTGVALTFAERFSRSGDTLTLVLVEALADRIAHHPGRQGRQRRQDAAAQREQAVQAERLRIARELHDMIAHSIGIIAIQAGVGRRVIDTQPAEARNALAAIEDTSRDTLAALRRMLGSLRRRDPEAGTAPLDPAPGLAELDNLVERTRDAGVHVDVRRRGEPFPLPPDIDLSAFRLIQEAVTNVIRHAGTQRCDVTVDQRPGSLTIEITDDGRGGPAAGPGHGITGMRERVGLLDGEFTAGPQPGGGFRVAARIPLPAGTP